MREQLKAGATKDGNQSRKGPFLIKPRNNRKYNKDRNNRAADPSTMLMINARTEEDAAVRGRAEGAHADPGQAA